MLMSLDIRFYDDTKIYETTIESSERMLEYSFRFEYQKTTVTLFAFLLEESRVTTFLVLSMLKC